MDEILLKKIDSVLSDIENYTRYGAVYYDFKYKARPYIGKAFCKLCSACLDSNKTYQNCLQNARDFSYQSWIRGEAYIFRCWLGIYGIIIPVCIENDQSKITGAIEIGGLFPVGQIQKNIPNIISLLNKIDNTGNLSLLVSTFQGVKELQQIEFISFGEFMKEALCSSGLVKPETLLLNSEIWRQQNRIYERTEEFKNISIDKEKLICFLSIELAKKLELNQGDFEEKFDEFVAALKSFSENNLEKSKSAAITALSIIKMYKMNNIDLNEQNILIKNIPIEIETINREDNFEKLIIKLKKILLSKQNQTTKNEILAKVISFIENNFHKNIRVEDAADFAGSSTSTIMHRIRNETGMTFSEYINATRIKEAKRLLVYTDLSIGEIADRCGFSDQSYFSKVFYKYISISPREFRNMLYQKK
ncbi:MAG TPA: AraC family transcriptional regulator [Victivallales bacterium]|nr:AraC family transcriptional regulator [Victivallales bacterium]HPO91236.1 AraC family transcriptional regulator [Victivallales bacterium]